jgi:hypothetical protein
MRHFSSFALAFGCLTLALFGQAFSSLSGTITDPSGGLVPGATITIVNNETSIQRETASDPDGRFFFAQVVPGNYRLSAKAAGFSDVTIKSVQLQVNSPTTVNIKFEKVGALSETVMVEAAAQQINTTDASLGNAVGTQAIMELPFFARNVTNLLQLQPGVAAFGTGDYRDGAVNGGKSDQANVTLDGVDVNDQVNRSAFTSILRMTLDSVAEFRTTTTNSNADQGRGSGAEVALVTKSGTNNYHGSAYEYNRNTLFAANDFFSNRTAVPRAALNINVFGGSVGGPIIKGKFFFFANYEGRRDASAQTQNRTVPTDNVRNGIVQYHDTKGVLQSVGPDQIKTIIDPSHIGVNPNSLKIFNQYPHGNNPGSSTSDGLNFIGFRFNAPRHAKQDTYIARLDYTVDNAGKHQLFLRGNLQNDHTGSVPQFPGQPGLQETLANNKGIASGYTWVVRPNIVNTVRYGFTRQGGETTGLVNSPYTTFRNYDAIYGVSSATKRTVPVHNVSEDLSWTHGAHDLRFGATIRFISNVSSRNGASYHTAVTNASGLAGSGADLYANISLASGDTVSYTYAMAATLGLISQITARYNYKTDGTLLPLGAYVDRDFENNEYEMYAQDTWRLRRNLTLTAGLRYSLEPPVHEANGQQISSDMPLADWLGKRGSLAAQGLPQSQAGDLTYVLASSAQGRDMYPFHRNWAPRVGLAYTPSGNDGLKKFLFGSENKTSIRAGFGMYYDVIGQPLASTFNATAFGLSSSIGNPLNTLDSTQAPRFTDFWSVPGSILPTAPKGGFPTKQPYNFAITNSIDDQLKAPYTMNMNFSWGREFARGLFIQGSYVGRLSRHSLIQRDLAMPTNMKDSKSGMTYFQAMQALGTYVDILDPSRASANTRIPPIPFFENLWPGAAAGGFTATQNIANYYARSSNKGDFTNVLNGMDEICGTTKFNSSGRATALGCSVFGPNAIFNPQFGALAGWSSVGAGNYHAAQITVRKRFSQSLQFDFNYTWSKSLDMASVAENAATYSGFIVNSWYPGQLWSVSDYDATHQVNAYGIWRLPFGQGQRWGSQMNRVLDAIVGGWQFSAIYRQSSGLPLSTSTGSVWPTNWQLSNPAISNGNPQPATSTSHNGQLANGTYGPSLFSSQAAAAASLAGYRQTFAGEYGVRNNIRGDGYFNIDTLVAKEFKMPYKEEHRLQIRWECFNMTNSVRLDPRSASMSMTQTSTWGRLSTQLGQARQMQFAFRYTF